MGLPPVSVTVEDVAHVPIESAFDTIIPIDISTIFKRFGPIPAVSGTRDQSGDWDHAGVSRTVETSDGGSTFETLTAYNRPEHFSYRLGPFKGPLSPLVDHAEGEWRFLDRGDDRTRIRWTYTFHPRTLSWGVVKFAIMPFWKGYVKRALTRAIVEAERQHSSPAAKPAAVID